MRSRSIVSAIIFGMLVLGLVVGSWAQDSLEDVRSTPKDTTPYARGIVPEDYAPIGPSGESPSGAFPPSIFIVDTVVNNTNANLTNTDTANDGETSIAINPANPNEIVISAFSGGWGAGGNAVIYHTTDGGVTWTRRVTVPPPTGWPLGCPCDWAWDYGRNNELSAAILGLSPTTCPIPCGGTGQPSCTFDVVSLTTTNPAQAASFNYFDPVGPPVQAQETNHLVAATLGNVDQPWLLVNQDPTTANQDNVYVAYDDFNNTDGVDGADMRVAVSYGTNPPNFTVDIQTGNARPGVNPGHRMAKDPRTGYMYSLFQRNTVGGADPKNIDYMLNRSTDGGATWTLNGSASGIIVANADSTQPTPKFGTVNALLGGVDHAAVDPNTGDIYYVYGNRDSGTGNNRLAIRRIVSNGPAAGDVTVGPERFVNGQVQSAIPSVAVTNDGTVGVFYYTFDGFSSDEFPIFTAWLALSADKGETFTSQRLLTFLSSAKDDPTDTRQRVLGDYMQMKAVGNCFYGSFTGNGAPFGRPFANHDPIFFSTCVGPTISVPGSVALGDVCMGSTGSAELNVCNTGNSDLVVQTLTSSNPEFSVAMPSSGYPVAISPDFCFPFEVQFTPTSTGAKTSTLTIVSNDPANPSVTAQATGSGTQQRIATLIANSGNFGDVCVGSLKDLDLTISNSGGCPLSASSIVSSSAEFVTAGVISYPLVIAAGSSVHVPIRFQPTSTGAKAATITVNSNDPASPAKVVNVSGNAPTPIASTSGALDFGQLCVGDSKTMTVKVCDTGLCNLTVTGASLQGQCAGLELVNHPAFPLVISHDFCFDFNVKYTPTTQTLTNCTLVVNTDDPAHSVISFPITTSVGSPNLVLDPTSLSGIYAFPTTVSDPTGSLGCFSDNTVVVRNNGTCPAVITGIAATAPFTVVTPTQFPVTLPVGQETLKVTVRFKPVSDPSGPSTPGQTSGTLTVTSTYGGTTTPSLAGLCGEAVVHSGVRVFVVDGSDNPINSLDSLTLTSKGVNTPQPISIRLKDVAPQTSMVCGNTVRYHLDTETLPPTQTTGSNPKSSYELTAKEGNKQANQSFTLGQCQFKEFIIRLK
jgi:hypothetical protein